MKEAPSAIAIFLSFVAYIPYYRDIIKGKTHPHIYSWSLWGVLTFLIFALQIKGGAGSATWVTAMVGFLCLGVILLGLKSGKTEITTSALVIRQGPMLHPRITTAPGHLLVLSQLVFGNYQQKTIHVLCHT